MTETEAREISLDPRLAERCYDAAGGDALRALVLAVLVKRRARGGDERPRDVDEDTDPLLEILLAVA